MLPESPLKTQDDLELKNMLSFICELQGGGEKYIRQRITKVIKMQNLIN